MTDPAAKSELALAVERLDRAKTEYGAASDAVRKLLDTEMRRSVVVKRCPPARLSGDEIGKIVAIVAAHHGFSPSDLIGRQRTPRVSDARQRCMVIARRLLSGITLEEVGSAFRRDHGTVIWAEKTIRARTAMEPDYGADFECLVAKCASALARPAS